MRLIFLGTGGYHPNERRHTASLLLPEIGVALDAGTGFFRVPGHLRSRRLDIFLTHAHLDHVCGLTFLLVPVLTGEIERVRVFGTASTLAAVREHLFAGALFPVDPPYEWVPLSEGDSIRLDGNGTLSHFPLEHPGGSIGFRLDFPDRSMAYVTDTTAPGDYETRIRGVDLLVHECYFSDADRDWAVKTGHSNATEVAEVARDAGVGRLMLLHVDPQHTDDDPVGLDSMKMIFPHIVLAEDLLETEF